MRNLNLIYLAILTLSLIFPGTNDVQTEMDEMRSEHEAMKALPKVTFKEMLVNPALRSPLIIAVMMMLAQQLSGINAAIFFSTSIFKEAGLDETQAQSATLGMGAMNVAMTFVSLVLIEKAGRKTLMIIGLSVMVVTTTMLLVCLLAAESVPALAYVSIVMVITFVVGFATGPGSIPWFFVTELFTQGARGMATSVAVVTNWTANFLVGLGFTPLMVRQTKVNVELVFTFAFCFSWLSGPTFSSFSSFCKSSLSATFGSKSPKPRTKPSKKSPHNSDKISKNLERPHSSKSRFSFPPPSWKEKEIIARDLDHQFLKPFRNRTTNICNIKYIPKMFCVKEKNRLLKKRCTERSCIY